MEIAYDANAIAENGQRVGRLPLKDSNPPNKQAVNRAREHQLCNRPHLGGYKDQRFNAGARARRTIVRVK